VGIGRRYKKPASAAFLLSQTIYDAILRRKVFLALRQFLGLDRGRRTSSEKAWEKFMALYEIANILKRECPVYGVPLATVGSLAGVSSGMLSSYVNGVRRCPNDHEIKLHDAWAQLKKLIEYAAPLPLNFKKAGELRECIRLMESRELFIVVGRSGEAHETGQHVATDVAAESPAHE